VWYVVSYRDLKEILDERGVAVAHAIMLRSVVKNPSLIVANAHADKRPTASSLRIHETYMKVKGK